MILKNKRNLWLFIFVFFLLVSFQPKAEAASTVDISAKAAILMDEESGRVLFAENAEQRLPQASLTKIMTALLVIENGDLHKDVVISKNAEETGESSIWLEEGEVLSRNQLLYALMLPSANDAAVALAESVAGSEQEFVSQMNERARELSLKNTHFANPHGLDAEGHYSSAFDLASLTREGLEDPLFRDVVTTKEMSIPWPGHDWERALINRNQLLNRYQGSRGVKTGYTSNAGCCLVGAAQRGDMKLITVVMNSYDMYGDTERLLNYGFDNYEMDVLEESNQTYQVKVSGGTDEIVSVKPERQIAVAVLPDEKGQLSIKTELVEQVEAPVKKGAVLGKGTILLNDKKIDEINYIAQEDVAKKPPFWIAFVNWFRSLFS
ncbi:MAG: D-alanyl-D-alanine carboxypeptidase family protein [Syntrophaceticus sp.]|jgi:D-alanyl-D-alanine carboxypeptidase (penicillin-binding protein 5/6)